jgi:iron complex outermembrane receptor protein
VALAQPRTVEDLKQLSIEDLANIKVTSVSRSSEPVSDAPGSVFVITHDDIVRAGAMTLPEMLRLAPNLQVAQINGYAWAITGRGFNAYASNKLLVQIDGRAVYSPYFNGVFWDIQNVLPDDVKRIEVISGPGATLWGPNAVNGIINIVTRDADQTTGGLVSVGAGNRSSRGSLRYGGRVGSDLTWRVYGAAADDTRNLTEDGGDGRDAWRQRHGGFRADWRPGIDHLMVEGNVYNINEEVQGPGNAELRGVNLTANWRRSLAGGGSAHLLAYYQHDARLAAGTNLGDRLDTYAMEWQHNLAPGERHAIVWGIDERVWRDEFPNAPLDSAPVVLYFSPERRTINIADVYAQDTISLDRHLSLIPGLKIQTESPYTGVAVLPSLRLAWKPDPDRLVWAALSRALRDPSREDRDLYGIVGGTTPFLAGGDFHSEKVTALEAGYRARPGARLSWSVSTFFNRYTDLRSTDFAPGGTLPVNFANGMEGDGYGVEFWATWQANDWWRIAPGLFLQRQHLRFKPGTGQAGSIADAGNDPTHQLLLRSTMTLPHRVSLDLDLRKVGALPDPRVPAYVELNGRLGWDVDAHLTLSLIANNLLHARHLEFVSSSFAVPVEVGRTVFAQAQWRF